MAGRLTTHVENFNSSLSVNTFEQRLFPALALIVLKREGILSELSTNSEVAVLQDRLVKAGARGTELCIADQTLPDNSTFNEGGNRTMIVRRMAPSEGGWLRSYGEFDELRRQMQSLMGAPEAAFLGRSGAGVFPAVNVTQDENNLYVRAELPGMKASELQVTAVKNRLSRQAHAKFSPRMKPRAIIDARGPGVFSAAVSSCLSTSRQTRLLLTTLMEY